MMGLSCGAYPFVQDLIFFSHLHLLKRVLEEGTLLFNTKHHERTTIYSSFLLSKICSIELKIGKETI
jgi:hypothetical protein